MKTKKSVMIVLGMVLAIAMSFALLFSSYASNDNTTGSDGKQKTESEAIEKTDDGSSVQAEPGTEGRSPQTEKSEEGTESEETSKPDAQTDDEQNADADQVEKEVGDKQEKEKVKATRTTYVWNGGNVRVTAVLSDAKAIPDDARLVVKTLDSRSGGYAAYMAALNRGSDSFYGRNNTLLYDVAFVKDGKELQPESGTVSVTFDFLDDQLAESIGAKKASDVNVVHLPLKDRVRDRYDTTADATNIGAGDITVDKLTSGENGLNVSVKNEKVRFVTSSFSVFAYTVDFEYTDPYTGKVYTFNLEGTGSITLKDLVVILGIASKSDADEFVRNVEDVKFSDESLVEVKKTS